MSASYDATKKDLVLLDRLLVNGLEARYHNPNDLMRLFQGKAKYLDKVKRKKDARPLPIPDRRLSSPETKQDLAGPTIVRPPDSDTKPAHSSQLTFDRDKPPGKKSPAAARSHEQLPAILPSMNSMASQLMLRSTRRSRTFDVPQIGECFFIRFASFARLVMPVLVFLNWRQSNFCRLILKITDAKEFEKVLKLRCDFVRTFYVK